MARSVSSYEGNSFSLTPLLEKSVEQKGITSILNPYASKQKEGKRFSIKNRQAAHEIQKLNK